mgnify:CR=1 FL=1
MSTVKPDVRLEAVSRALCRAAGKNPDELSYPGRKEFFEEGNRSGERFVQYPVWEDFSADAALHIAAFDVLSSG